MTVPDRNGKQCRERWLNHMHPLLNLSVWTTFDEQLLYLLQLRMKNSWAKFSQDLLGRSDNAIKNYWNGVVVHNLDKLKALVDG